MSERTRNWLFLGFVLGAITTLVGIGWTQRSRFGPLETGARAPGFEARTLDGRAASLDSLRGRVVLLNVWATWCPPCVQEMPALERLHRELGPLGLAVIGVNVDASVGAFDRDGNPGGNVGAFVEQLGLTFPIWLDPEGRIEKLYRINGLPTTFIIDRNGRIVRQERGAVAWDQPPHSTQIRQLLER
ncbi:MAG TPA: TlpA disulfide reductase family protein [Longimicrobiales bacterium]